MLNESNGDRFCGPMVSMEEFSRLLDVLYSAALDPAKWEDFLAGLSRATESRVCVFLTADTRLGVMCKTQGGIHPLNAQDIVAYNQRYAQSDPFRGPCLADPRPRIAQSEELLPHGKLLESALYRDLLEPNNCRYATLALLTLTLRRLEVITIWRSAAQGPMPPDAMRLLELLFPHIQRALEVRQTLGVAAQQVSAAATLADASPTPTFLLQQSGQLVRTNAAADALLAGDGPLVRHGGALAPALDSARAEFRDLLRKASRLHDAPFPLARVHALALPRADGGMPVQLVAHPIPALLADQTGADVLLLVADSASAGSRFPDTLLRSLYGMTPAETDIANGLLMGFSLQEIAGVRGVAAGTVRAQLKSILSKTGAARQSDLVRQLMALPQMHSGA